MVFLWESLGPPRAAGPKRSSGAHLGSDPGPVALEWFLLSVSSVISCVFLVFLVMFLVFFVCFSDCSCVFQVFLVIFHVDKISGS